MRAGSISIVFLALVMLSPLRDAGQASSPPPTPLQTPLLYRNIEYGFCIALPSDWRGFKVVTKSWDGGGENGHKAETGPMLIIRHPRWTDDNPYQDIPILVFTPAQWRDVDPGEFSISAAPYGPGKLGRNNKYVFALPPRFAGFDDDVGAEEVLQLLSQNPFHAPCTIHKKHA